MRPSRVVLAIALFVLALPARGEAQTVTVAARPPACEKGPALPGGNDEKNTNDDLETIRRAKTIIKDGTKTLDETPKGMTPKPLPVGGSGMWGPPPGGGMGGTGGSGMGGGGGGGGSGMSGMGGGGTSFGGGGGQFGGHGGPGTGGFTPPPASFGGGGFNKAPYVPSALVMSCAESLRAAKLMAAALRRLAAAPAPIDGSDKITKALFDFVTSSVAPQKGAAGGDRVTLLTCEANGESGVVSDLDAAAKDAWRRILDDVKKHPDPKMLDNFRKIAKDKFPFGDAPPLDPGTKIAEAINMNGCSPGRTKLTQLSVLLRKRALAENKDLRAYVEDIGSLDKQIRDLLHDKDVLAAQEAGRKKVRDESKQFQAFLAWTKSPEFELALETASDEKAAEMIRDTALKLGAVDGELAKEFMNGRGEVDGQAYIDNMTMDQAKQGLVAFETAIAGVDAGKKMANILDGKDELKGAKAGIDVFRRSLKFAAEGNMALARAELGKNPDFAKTAVGEKLKAQLDKTKVADGKTSGVYGTFSAGLALSVVYLDAVNGKLGTDGRGQLTPETVSAIKTGFKAAASTEDYLKLAGTLRGSNPDAFLKLGKVPTAVGRVATVLKWLSPAVDAYNAAEQIGAAAKSYEEGNDKNTFWHGVTATGHGLSSAGGILLLVPEPTGVTKILGAALIIAGLVTSCVGEANVGMDFLRETEGDGIAMLKRTGYLAEPSKDVLRYNELVKKKKALDDQYEAQYDANTRASFFDPFRSSDEKYDARKDRSWALEKISKARAPIDEELKALKPKVTKGNTDPSVWAGWEEWKGNEGKRRERKAETDRREAEGKPPVRPAKRIGPEPAW